MKKILILFLFIGSGISYISYQDYIDWNDCSTLQILPEKITVEKWDTFSSVLREHTWSEYFSKIYLKFSPADFWLQAWNYNITTECWINNFIEQLRTPINETDEFLTFLEGWNMYDIDEYLTGEWLIATWEFISYVTSWNFDRHNYIEWLASLEWYLYPDTYAINPNTFTIEWLTNKMLDNFHSKVYQPLFSHADSETIFETVILASIVEKEEKNPAERPTVAGILKKRLDEWWMIGADITVCYAHRLTSEECKLSVTKYLYEKNDYNTRQMVWLPAGPIWNPSLSSIESTLYSKNSPYYYYLHDITTWQIYYGKNEVEHNRNKQLYIQ